MVIIFEGKIVEIINVLGCFGLEKMFNLVKCMWQFDGIFWLFWIMDGVEIDVDLWLVSSVQVQVVFVKGDVGGGV